jgi:hypothetical protein
MMLDATQRFAAPLTAERLYGWQVALFPTGFSGTHPILVGMWHTDAGGAMQVLSDLLHKSLGQHTRAHAATDGKRPSGGG